jgi:hypothetical protein
MSIARGLFLAVTGAIACSIPWQDTANVDGPAPLLGSLSIASTGSAAGNAPDRVSLSAPASSSRDAPSNGEERAAAPEVAVVAPRFALGSRQAISSLPADRSQVVRDLQRELRRVGCYDGELHGVWTPASRGAMKAFLDRANAALPADEPDQILLSLVQAARDRVCGAECPAGQGLAEEGRCVPNAILAGRKGPPAARAASARTEPTPAHAGWSVKQTPTTASRVSPPEGERVGIAGPLPEASAAPAPDSKAAPAATAGRSRSADARRTGRAPQGIFGIGIFGF